MTKRIPQQPKPRTHFEQIPLEIVRKVTVRDLSKKHKTGTGNVIREPAARKTEPYSMGAHRWSEYVSG
jgi:hypothetical protein